jgi:chromosome segregation ATPase
MELGAAEHFSTAAKASDIQSSIASIRQKMEETTAAFQVKQSAVTQSNAKINDSRSQINRLQGMIQAEANKEGLRQGPRYRSQIQDHERIIETENNRIKEFVAIETKYNETMNEMQKQLAELTKKLESVKQ